MSKYIAVVLAVLAGSLAYGFNHTQNELETTKDELQTVRNERNALARERNALEQELDTSRTLLEEVEGQLDVTNIELEDTRVKLDAATAELEEALLKIAAFDPPVYLNEGENLLLTSVHNLFLRQENLSQDETFQYRYTGSIGLGVGQWAINLVFEIDDEFVKDDYKIDYAAEPFSCVRLLQFDELFNPAALELICEATVDWAIHTHEPLHALDLMPLKDYEALLRWKETSDSE
ncbi:MAG: hypothetical protein OXG07_10885 [Anaerolineaceae bacterium]|nr:hypothetical protein [Anaerolineaceae bacterium]